jgi:general secretion pathway protein C
LSSVFSAAINSLIGRARNLPVASVNKLICGGLVFWLLLILWQLIALFVFTDTRSKVPLTDSSVTATVQQQKPQADISELLSINLLGVAGAISEPAAEVRPVEDEAVLNASKTKLNLMLKGIVHTFDTADSVAVIVYQNQQDQYYIGDKLPAGNEVSLAKVMLDHVILDNAGRFESLWLYDDEKTTKQVEVPSARSSVKESNLTDRRKKTEVTELAKGYRDRLYKNPSSLAEVLRISPAQRNGKMMGYRVSPGRDRKQFSALGFESNDIVTSINGIGLTEPSKALEIYKLMRTATEASFTVDRNGDSVEVLVSLSDQ